MEHAPLVWMGASPTTLSQLDAVQRRAMNIIGPNSCLQRLELRRQVAALSFLFKLQCPPQHPILKKILSPRQQPLPASRTTRLQAAKSTQHDLQLANPLPLSARGSLSRSFPFCVTSQWNDLPPPLLQTAPDLKHMPLFKGAVNRHLCQNATWAYDYN